MARSWFAPHWSPSPTGSAQMSREPAATASARPHKGAVGELHQGLAEVSEEIDRRLQIGSPGGWAVQVKCWRVIAFARTGPRMATSGGTSRSRSLELIWSRSISNHHHGGRAWPRCVNSTIT